MRIMFQTWILTKLPLLGSEVHEEKYFGFHVSACKYWQAQKVVEHF